VFFRAAPLGAAMLGVAQGRKESSASLLAVHGLHPPEIARPAQFPHQSRTRLASSSITISVKL
jgi:hypothetical protein